MWAIYFPIPVSGSQYFSMYILQLTLRQLSIFRCPQSNLHYKRYILSLATYYRNLCQPVHIGKLNKTKLVDFARFNQSRNLDGCIVACSKEKSQ